MSRREEFATGASRMVDLYHRTTPEAAEAIKASGRFEPQEYDWDTTYFAKTKDMSGYGSSVVHVRVPEQHVSYDEDQAIWDDGSEVEDDDKHWVVPNKVLKPEHIVGVWHE
jgi:hypothetical protein